jgi:hypothetical protein
MTKAKSKSHKKECEHFIFEIKEWEPDYTFSVNLRGDKPGNYSEYVQIKLEATCIEPKKCAGAACHFTLSSRRHYFPAEAKILTLNEREKWLGELRLSPKGGSYYGPIPHESTAAIVSALSSKRLACVVLRGAPLYRGSSWCQSIDLAAGWEQ